ARRISTPTAAGTERAVRSEAEQPILLEVDELKKYFPIHGGFMRRVVGQGYAVDGVSLQIRRGENVGLGGEAGCGKKTLRRTNPRLLEPTAGKVTFDGKDVRSLDGKAMKRMRRRMQIIFQDPVASLNPRMPVSDLIGEGLVAQADKENRWGERPIRDKRVGD